VDERGGGLVQLWAGFFVFLVMLLFAVQVLFNLYAASVVTSISYDAARRVAGSDGGTAYRDEAVADARRALGQYADRVSFDWSATTTEEVVLRVQARNPSVLLPVLAGPIAFDRLDRTIRIRVERFQ
jgi:Flp pilus assembly protein TadG